MNVKEDNMDNINPFLIQGYISPDYFCDRNEETKKIISAYENEEYFLNDIFLSRWLERN
jgi:hypothetical protein